MSSPPEQNLIDRPSGEQGSKPISVNKATFQCGGFCQDGGTTTITNSTISGICNIFSSTISGNNSTGGNHGGGIMTFAGAEVNVVQTTIANNSAGTGGGITQGLNDVTVKIHLENSIVAGNTASTGSDFSGAVATHAGVNFIGITTGASGLGTLGANYLTGAPLLAPLGDCGGRTMAMALRAGSPAIEGAVLLGSTPATDQRGFARVARGLPDFGAYESGNAAGYGV